MSANEGRVTHSRKIFKFWTKATKHLSNYVHHTIIRINLMYKYEKLVSLKTISHKNGVKKPLLSTKFAWFYPTYFLSWFQNLHILGTTHSYYIYNYAFNLFKQSYSMDWYVKMTIFVSKYYLCLSISYNNFFRELWCLIFTMQWKLVLQNHVVQIF